MPGIGNLTAQDFQDRINHFDQSYVQDWNNWINALNTPNTAAELGRVLRRWQACRPNRMRRTREDRLHDNPYLEDLIAQSATCVDTLGAFDFDMRYPASYTTPSCNALKQFWQVFQQLSYSGRARNGLAGVVGISKAALLLSVGRVGPAFDSQVRSQLQIEAPRNPEEWIDALKMVTHDIVSFERVNSCCLQQAAPPQFQNYHAGRLYDIALGPAG
jgi:hypothetical protein